MNLDAEHFDKVVGRLERIWKIALACLLTILSGAIWAARIQWQVQDLGEWRSGASVKIDQHGAALESMKGHLGITSSHKADPPSKARGSALVWTDDRESPPPSRQ
jgi:hypothetical protein